MSGVKAVILVMTDRGLATALRIRESFPDSTPLTVFSHEKALLTGQQQTQSNLNLAPAVQVFNRLGDILEKVWSEYTVLIFIMATGIVVRQISPLIRRKDLDPAVLVLDEAGKFVIPLLSGHLGGANAWAGQIAESIKAQAVITTATDSRGMTAPDEYARRYGWKVEPLNHLPAVNSLLLERGYLNAATAYPLENEAQELLKDPHYRFNKRGEDYNGCTVINEKSNGTEDSDNDNINVIITAFPDKPCRHDCIRLIPPVLSVGVGCRRGVSAEEILTRITSSVNEIGASLKAIAGIYSIDLKADELGLIEAAKSLRVPFITFSAEQLQAVTIQNNLTRSNFVKEKIGVDGVCEAASLLGAQMGRLILPKTMGQGVTVAISAANSLSSALAPETPNT